MANFPDVGFQATIDQIASERAAAQPQPPRVVPKKVITVAKNKEFDRLSGLRGGNREYATIYMEDGSSERLTETTFGKKNYDVTGRCDMSDDNLYCVVTTLPSRQIKLFGSPKAIEFLNRGGTTTS